MSVDLVPVVEAALQLGIKEESVRKRIYRGSMRADKEPDGSLMVYLDDADNVQGLSTDDVHGHASGTIKDELVDVLQGEIAHLRRESERKDAIIMQLSQATTEQARTIRELEAPDPPLGEQGRTDPGSEAPSQGSSTRESAEADTRRPWWRRVFGG